MSFILLYVTYPSRPEAIRISSELLKLHLVACVNYHPIESMYWWEGTLTHNEEIVALYKTRMENIELVQSQIEKLHQYQTPCIIRLAEVTANEAYEQWIQDEMSSREANL